MKCQSCQREFKPTRAGQKFCSTACRVKNWHFKTAGSKVLSDHEARLSAIEKHLGINQGE